MKNHKHSIIFTSIMLLFYSSASAQESYRGIVLKAVKLKNTQIKVMKLYGTAQELEKLFLKENLVDCNFIMSGKSVKDLESIPVPSEILKSITENNKLIKIQLDEPSDFINVLKEARKKKETATTDSTNCNPEVSLCIGNTEASFSIGCEDDMSMEISTAGTLKLITEKNGVSVGVTLIDIKKIIK